MYRRGRPVEPLFEPGERLYRPYRKDHWIDGQFSPAGFKFPRHSVNRSRFSEPEDVLFSEAGEFDGWGVLEFAVEALPERLEAFLFAMKHAPEEENYSHSEIWCFRSEAPGQYVEPSPSIRKQFRAVMS